MTNEWMGNITINKRRKENPKLTSFFTKLSILQSPKRQTRKKSAAPIERRHMKQCILLQSLLVTTSLLTTN